MLNQRRMQGDEYQQNPKEMYQDSQGELELDRHRSDGNKTSYDKT
jgi:hypothetical protein